MRRFEKLWCEECNKIHFVEILTHDRRGRIVKTKCFGADFSPIINDENFYTRHRMRGYEVVRKIKRRYEPKFADLKVLGVTPAAAPEVRQDRKCLAEISMFVHGGRLPYNT